MSTKKVVNAALVGLVAEEVDVEKQAWLLRIRAYVEELEAKVAYLEAKKPGKFAADSGVLNFLNIVAGGALVGCELEQVRMS